MELNEDYYWLFMYVPYVSAVLVAEVFAAYNELQLGVFMPVL